MIDLNATFHHYIALWRLTPEGDPIVTRTSRLLPVRWQGIAAMLKIALEAEEELGNQLLAWWNGQGVPLVLASDGKAVLLERAVQDEGSLADLVRDGRDDEATRIICAVVAKLHLPRNQPIPPLVPPFGTVPRNCACRRDLRRHSVPFGCNRSGTIDGCA